MLILENDVIFTQKAGVRMIKLNRPGKKNAMNQNMYEKITNVLNEDASNDNIVVTVITGSGEYFSSGNDLIDSMKAMSSADNIQNAKTQRLNTVEKMIKAFINYPKLLIAVINGPAIGVGVTLLALCDIVYASDRATFNTPFLKLGICAEAASSYTFTNILGRSKASEVLLLNHKLSAQEAHQFGFVSSVIPHAKLNEFIEDLRKYGQLPPESVRINKNLITRNFKSILVDCVQHETKQLSECFDSEAFSNAMMQFMASKTKSKL